MKRRVYDLYCGLGGWSRGFIAEGYEAIGFDIERHQYGEKRYPGQLVLQDARTLHGSQFRDGAAIVASPPCQRYSRMAMPFSRGKREAAAIRADETGAMLAELNELFDTCFRLQREASEAAGRYIPMVVENVKGAQPWVGRAKAHFGSYYLWGDVEWVGGRIVGTVPRFGESLRPAQNHKNVSNGSWFGIQSGGRSGEMGNPVSLPGGWNAAAVLKREGTKQRGSGPEWFDVVIASVSSGSDSRKAASAMIAEIPFDLASYIARILKR